ncbi:hypothetical protein ATE47_03360 [Chryseobacterium sp. IHB B 17019]|jgi:hypothetical protein|uniref:hypothetical protein n=1 Tax=Chryseobacterium sp. IHB B 17019 TaxID=1721091 RepID=UPI0007218F68|nr:hypothetical protein [Chryseobacterium sp. IHB B 17019]ALR29622.1 hypothetical protein ATE47_03360 [Chryseobacterium sp. IHB B 17019]
MKKIVILSLSLLFSALSVYSCDNQGDITNDTTTTAHTQNKIGANASKLGAIENLTSLDAVSNIGKEDYFDGFKPVSTAELDFTHGENHVKVNSGLDAEGNYVFDMDGDRLIDLKVVPVTSDYSEIVYVDGEGNKISRAKVELDGTDAYVTILEVYSTSSKYTQLTQKGKWRACFEGVAGSAEGIAGAVVCSFGGPWCYAGYYSGIAVGCLFA